MKAEKKTVRFVIEAETTLFNSSKELIEHIAKSGLQITDKSGAQVGTITKTKAANQNASLGITASECVERHKH